MSPRNRVARIYPQALDSLFVASYDSQVEVFNPTSTWDTTTELLALVI
jgi:hypothetical protein